MVVAVVAATAPVADLVACLLGAAAAATFGLVLLMHPGTPEIPRLRDLLATVRGGAQPPTADVPAP
jgi:hypothetical protein